MEHIEFLSQSQEWIQNGYKGRTCSSFVSAPQTARTISGLQVSTDIAFYSGGFCLVTGGFYSCRCFWFASVFPTERSRAECQKQTDPVNIISANVGKTSTQETAFVIKIGNALQTAGGSVLL
ncbi:hypothetical protein GDO78_012135 [Eleutherodactylus coqui]|uniref:Uncharacterized protein n=1 Tax=Eleutherodactylus coqui TaxID=57060 RepID=A0A8J6F5I1_ELECQ|nr:hypothetical protein GDO78_012135 [Eleutherodactylus coqui]